MGVTYLLRGDGREFETPLPREDYDTIDYLRCYLPGAASVMIDETSRDGEEEIPLEDMLGAVLLINAFIRDEAEKLPYTYEFDCHCEDTGGGSRAVAFSTGGASGIRLPGDGEHIYCIWAGLDQCEIQKLAIRPDGTGEVVERRDIRDLEELRTASNGVIMFRKRRSRVELRRRLSQMRRFLTTLPEGTWVTRILC